MTGEQEEMGLIPVLAESFKIVANATDHIAGLAARFVISMNAYNAYFVDRFGKVRADLQCMVILPTGSYKTPLKDFIELFYHKTVETFRYNEEEIQSSRSRNIKTEEAYPLFSEFTVPAIRRELDKLKDKKSRYKMLILHDEISTLVKKQSVSGFAEVFEFLSQAADGKIQSYATIRSGHNETYPPLHNPQFLLGTPTFYPFITQVFWEQGYAQRVLFGKNEGINISSAIGEDSSELIVDSLKTYLDDVKKVERVVGTEEFNTMYDKYKQEMDKKRNKAMLEGRMTTENFAEVKFPKLALKLAMIHAISRMDRDKNYRELSSREIHSEEGEFVNANAGVEYPRREVTMDVQDLENALRDLEIQKEVYLSYYNEWVERNQMKYRPMENTDSINRFISKCKLLMNEPDNIYQVVKNNEDGQWYARKNKNGQYLPFSKIRESLGWSQKSFLEVVDSLIETGKIEVLENVKNTEQNNKNMKLLRLTL